MPEYDAGRHALDPSREPRTETFPAVQPSQTVAEPNGLLPVLVLAALGVVGGAALLIIQRSAYVIGGVGAAWVAVTAGVVVWTMHTIRVARENGEAARDEEIQTARYERDMARQDTRVLQARTNDLQNQLDLVNEAALAGQQRYVARLRDLVPDPAGQAQGAATLYTSAGQLSGDDPVMAAIADVKAFLASLRMPAMSTDGTVHPGFARVLADIGRRMQDLAHRVIQELDELIGIISDPDILDHLWIIDPLLTRLRRISENLILLEGPTAPRQWRYPIPLRESLMQAKAEIRDYRRVQFVQPIIGMTLGHVAVPLSHLVAELLENAANNSKPDTVITVRVREVSAGIAVKVQDEGFGLSDSDFDRINSSLNADVDIAPLLREGRLVGLWVVANIARSYGFKVELERNIVGGVTATVVVPPELVHSGDVIVDAPATVPPSARTPAVGTPAHPGLDDATRSRTAIPPAHGQTDATEWTSPDPAPESTPASPAHAWPEEHVDPWPHQPAREGAESAGVPGELPQLPKRAPGAASLASGLRSTASREATASPDLTERPTMHDFLSATQAIRGDSTTRSDDSDDVNHPSSGSQGDPNHNAG